MFYKIKSNFETSTFFTKLKLYILPILLAFLLYLVYFGNQEDENITQKNSKILDFENKKFTGSVLELSNTIEELAKNKKLNIQKIQNQKEQITLQIKTKKSNLLEFLESVETLNNFTKISTLSLKKLEDDSYLVDLKIDISKYYIKNKIPREKEEEIQEIVVKKEENIENSSPEFELKGVVGDYIFINGSWQKLNDKILDYDIKSISKDFVILQKDDEIIKLEVNEIEYFKEKN